MGSHIYIHIKSVLYFPLPKPWNSFGKIVILCDKQHHFVKWHSVNFVWGEGRWRGPPPMRRDRLRLVGCFRPPTALARDVSWFINRRCHEIRRFSHDTICWKNRKLSVQLLDCLYVYFFFFFLVCLFQTGFWGWSHPWRNSLRDIEENPHTLSCSLWSVST